MLTGLGVAALGAGLFFPASKLLAFGPCLVALFVLAAGLSILETSANPFAIAMGPEGIATQRPNLAQAFNPVGANIDSLLGAVLILPRITTPGTKLTAPQLHQAQGKDLSLVVGPYLGIAVVLVLIGLLMAARTALSEGLYLAARRCERSVSSIAEGAISPRPEATRSPPLLGRGMVVLFIALICCFTAWGIAQDLTTPMVAGFKRIFAMSTFQASLVQLAYFGAYFLLALPAAFINQRFGYKTGILSGLVLAALGAFLFFPASKIMTYDAFLVALFAMAAGCSMLETSANPYVISLGAESTATRRLNLAQSFNPVGTNIGVLLASTLILPKLSDPVDLSSLTTSQLHTIRAGELGAVMGPYIGLALLLVVIAAAIASQKVPPIVEEFPHAGPHEGGTRELFRVLWRNKRYRFGVVAQFMNVGAQVCAWTYVIQYVGQALGGSLVKGGAYLQASLLIFLASRFLMTWVIGHIRATKVLAVLAFLAVVLCVFAMSSPNLAGVVAVVSLSFCLSLMFPTIYGVALKGLGPATKFGAAGLVMAIVGGAIMPVLQGKLVDATSPAFSFIVPAFCFAVVGLYALYDLKAEASVTGGQPTRDVGRATPASPPQPTEGTP